MNWRLKRNSHLVLTYIVLLLPAASLLAAGCYGQAVAPVITVDHGPNSAEPLSKPYVILVSLDGFRYDYAKRYHAEHLLAPGAQG
jgi:hypothetical protein